MRKLFGLWALLAILVSLLAIPVEARQVHCAPGNLKLEAEGGIEYTDGVTWAEINGRTVTAGHNAYCGWVSMCMKAGNDLFYVNGSQFTTPKKDVSYVIVTFHVCPE